MRHFKLIFIFFLFVVSTTYASVARPFNFIKWNFKKDIDLAYVLMHSIDNGILTKSQDKAGKIKSQEILAKLNKLNIYSNTLQKIIKNRLSRSRFQKEVELPLFKILEKYKRLTKNHKNKSFIENPEYTKLIVEKIIKKVAFLENYFQAKFKNARYSEKIKKRINPDKSRLKSLKGRPSSPPRSKFSNLKTSKKPQNSKECNKRRILNKCNANRENGELSNELESEDLCKGSKNLEESNEDLDENLYELNSRDDWVNEEDQGEDEFFDLL
ncbi:MULTISPECIES: hypothetical protein [Borreliella]|uniref:Outer membrane protein n=2 Tax=Borreliella TaxID=64895 RepID=C0R888_BORVA|nr:hypothetical protein [Borreliella valaisiana]ACN52683.1 outer membrane protein [Borreliella valaisiana VS116]WKC76652.1 hypothetical protein QIA32_00430 [Borreliella valaisiana]WLN25703.1 hypothetical protein KJD10_04550 [Borreliella valaisiana]WVN14667.1 hypothetical protein KJD09_04895 [Borreliella valaisiana]